MKERLKYYLRGLGTGILVTMILMMVSNADAAQSTVNDNDMADTREEYSLWETKEREESIAVIEREEESTETESVLDEAVIQQETEWETIESEMTVEEVLSMEQSEEADANDETDSNIEASDIEESASAPEESVEIQESEQAQESLEDAGQQTVDVAVTIQIVKGDGSGTVARKLQNAGLIDNASEFDAYLMQHGYDKRIRIGTVKIEAGSTWMEIADKLSGK